MNREIAELRGFTLIELMVSLAVLALLLAMAMPSFIDFRQRTAIRGAADQIASAWGEARFEALRQNRLIKVAFVTDSSGAFCIGTAPATAADDNTSCDCLTSACSIANYPASSSSGGQSEWRGVIAVGNPTMGDTDTDLTGVVVLDPKRGNLTQSADAGTLSLRSPTSGRDYRLNITVDRNGRAFICEPTAAANKLPEFSDRRC